MSAGRPPIFVPLLAHALCRAAKTPLPEVVKRIEKSVEDTEKLAAANAKRARKAAHRLKLLEHQTAP